VIEDQEYDFSTQKRRPGRWVLTGSTRVYFEGTLREQAKRDKPKDGRGEPGSWERLGNVFMDILKANLGEEVEGLTYHKDENGDKVRYISATVPELPIGPKGTFTVYKAVAQNGKTYWGLTMNFAQRVAQHGNRFLSKPVEVFKNIPSKGAGRGIEQLMIDATKGGLKNLDNAINSIAKNNPNLAKYYQEAITYLKGL